MRNKLLNLAAVLGMLLGSNAASAQTAPVATGKANKYSCNKGMRFTIFANRIQYGDYPDRIILQVPGEKLQTLTRDPDDRSTWKNKNWSFYEFKNFHNLSDERNPNRNYDCG